MSTDLVGALPNSRASLGARIRDHWRPLLADALAHGSDPIVSGGPVSATITLALALAVIVLVALVGAVLVVIVVDLWRGRR